VAWSKPRGAPCLGMHCFWFLMIDAYFIGFFFPHSSRGPHFLGRVAGCNWGAGASFVGLLRLAVGGAGAIVSFLTLAAFGVCAHAPRSHSAAGHRIGGQLLGSGSVGITRGLLVRFALVFACCGHQRLQILPHHVTISTQLPINHTMKTRLNRCILFRSNSTSLVFHRHLGFPWPPLR